MNPTAPAVPRVGARERVGPGVPGCADAFERIVAILEREGYAGWDPYDALSSPVLRSLGRTRVLRGAAIQALKRSPVNIRPLLRVPRQRFAMTLALAASAHARLERSGVGESGRAARLADDVAERALNVGGEAAWGYEFDVQTRWGYYRGGAPNAVASAFAAQALLDASELSGGQGFRDIARSAIRFATANLLVDAGGERFFAYHPGSRVPIHNASVLLAGVAARCADDGSEELAAARAVVGFTVARQSEDGSWPYGEGPRLSWVDGYHTAYVLDGLAAWQAREPTPFVGASFARGIDLYIRCLIDSDGVPRASLRSRYPVDATTAAAAISTLSRLAGHDERALALASRVLCWTLGNLRRRDGGIAFQLHRRYRNVVPYARWSDAQMLLALADFLVATGESDAG